MAYLIHGFDKPGHLAVRTAHRTAHLEYLERYGAKLRAAGPTLDDDGQMNGSLVILDIGSRAEVEVFVAHDPYAKAGLFEKVIVQQWKQVLP